jgi:hypothetical protein
MISLARADEVSNGGVASGFGTFRTCRTGLTMSAVEGKGEEDSGASSLRD